MPKKRRGRTPGRRAVFQRLVAEVCGGAIGAIFCIEASRLARNGRDWHHLIELCGMVGAVVIDPDGIYDPGIINDRRLLGLKGTMSEFELNLLRQRSLERFAKRPAAVNCSFFFPWVCVGTQTARSRRIPIAGETSPTSFPRYTISTKSPFTASTANVFAPKATPLRAIPSNMCSSVF